MTLSQEIKILPDAELAEQLERVALALELEGTEIGWGLRWARELLNGDITSCGILTPVTLRKVLTLFIRARLEFVRGMRAHQDGLTLTHCPHSGVMAHLDHWVEYDGVNWRTGWRFSAAVAKTDPNAQQDISAPVRAQNKRAITVEFTSGFETRLAALQRQYPGFEQVVAQGIGLLAIEARTKRYKNPEKVREHFLPDSWGIRSTKLLYQCHEGSLLLVDIEITELQPPMF